MASTNSPIVFFIFATPKRRKRVRELMARLKKTLKNREVTEVTMAIGMIGFLLVGAVETVIAIETEAEILIETVLELERVS